MSAADPTDHQGKTRPVDTVQAPWQTHGHYPSGIHHDPPWMGRYETVTAATPGSVGAFTWRRHIGRDAGASNGRLGAGREV